MRAIQAVSRGVSALGMRASAATPSTRALHVSAAFLSKENPGPVETKLRQEAAASKLPEGMDPSTLAPHPPGAKVYSAKIKRLAEEIANLTMLESMDLSDALREKLRLAKTELLFPGGGMPMGGGGGAGAAAGPAGAGAPAAGAAKPAAAAAAPPKEEKTHVDIKLKTFDQKNKIKVIKEIRGVTNLGLKEAKDLVEGAPCTIMQKVKREDAAKMIEKLKAETGAEFELI